MMEYRLLRRHWNSDDDSEWLLCTKGERGYILKALELNMRREVLNIYDWKIELVR